MAVTHVVAGAAHTVDCIVLTEPRDADSTGLTLRANPGPTRLLGVGNGGAYPVATVRARL